MSGENMKPLAQFITELGITLEHAPAFANPNMGDSSKMNHYSVKLSRKDEAAPGKRREFVTVFSKGLGHVVKARRSWEKDKPIPPAVDEVLDCIASDSSSIENARGFEDWASDFGYDPDSKKAEAIFRACFDASKQLKAFLGDERYNELLWNVERL